jgi:hypothetical protein
VSPKPKVQVGREPLTKAQDEAAGGDMTVTRTWKEPAPVRGALSKMDVADAGVWADRLRFDRARAASNQSSELAAITATVEARSRNVGAHALILSGSTARARRTRVSDLDYHVIGGRPEIGHPAEDIDLFCDDAEAFMAKLRAGDDLVHWSVWYGCILFDDGIVQRAASYAASHDGWPDATRKLRQARSALSFTARIVESGDTGAALEQVRGVLSLTARWLLLAHDVFPLSRDELSDQVLDLGCLDLAAALHRSIHCEPELDELATGVRLVKYLTSLSAARARRARLPSLMATAD